ncbi:uncharacterized protein LOC118185606 [Stegodyphus dumicola]|uniref:uncharacterized protein LOC118185606 n=1 Tax=Stegodyphus dumicola TaxID=202533 RepID=UPI0015B0F121|nr:uncharacterized protein LOC118185606 [Stegodyphus dumicola]
MQVLFLCVFIPLVVSEFNLTVVHITDLQSHWFEFNENGDKCSQEESITGKCFGGFPRHVSLVHEIRKKENNVLVLSSGEFYLGRSLNALHGWKLARALLPYLDLDAMSLSNHDFNSGMFELSAFLYAMKFPVLCANMWARNTSFIYSRVNRSAVFNIGGEKVGVVGYVHPKTLQRSRKAASVEFLPEIPAIQEEVDRLQEEGVNKIIALGHSGYYVDLEIAAEVKGVDIVMGGNSDIMLRKPESDDVSTTVGNIHGNFPRIHHHESDENEVGEDSIKNRTLILHIPQHGTYVGVMRMTFDNSGNIIHESGEPILLDSSIPQDEETLHVLQNAATSLEKIAEHSRLPDSDEILAVTVTDLEGSSRKCRMEECTLGNMVADAMLYCYMKNAYNETAQVVDTELWEYVDAVVLNSGIVRSSLRTRNITIKNLLHSLFLGDFMERVYMSGQQLKVFMEHSVWDYDPNGVTSPGAFLHVAGIRIEYDLQKPPGYRVRNLQIRCKNCISTYEPVKPSKTYFIAMSSFLSSGGDGFPESQLANSDDLGQFDVLLIVEYLRDVRILHTIIDGRITFFKNSDDNNSNSTITKQSENYNTTSLVSPPLSSSSMKPEVSQKIQSRSKLNISTTKYTYTSVMKGDALVNFSAKASPMETDEKEENISNFQEMKSLQANKENETTSTKRKENIKNKPDHDISEINAQTRPSTFESVSDLEMAIRSESVSELRLKSHTSILPENVSLKQYKEQITNIAKDGNSSISASVLRENNFQKTEITENRKILFKDSLAKNAEKSEKQSLENLNNISMSNPNESTFYLEVKSSDAESDDLNQLWMSRLINYLFYPIGTVLLNNVVTELTTASYLNEEELMLKAMNSSLISVLEKLLKEFETSESLNTTKNNSYISLNENINLDSLRKSRIIQKLISKLKERKNNLNAKFQNNLKYELNSTRNGNGQKIKARESSTAHIAKIHAIRNDHNSAFLATFKNENSTASFRQENNGATQKEDLLLELLVEKIKEDFSRIFELLNASSTTSQIDVKNKKQHQSKSNESVINQEEASSNIVKSESNEEGNKNTRNDLINFINSEDSLSIPAEQRKGEEEDE